MRIMENYQEKCMEYWPQKTNEELTFGDFHVKSSRPEDRDDIYRKTSITLRQISTKSKRQVNHYAFLVWPEMGVPEGPDDLLSLLTEIDESETELSDSHHHRPPVLVHCTDGAGRTGTFVTLDYCIRRLNAQSLVDIQRAVEILRQQRCGFITTGEQYLFCHRALQNKVQKMLADPEPCPMARRQSMAVKIVRISESTQPGAASSLLRKGSQRRQTRATEMDIQLKSEEAHWETRVDLARHSSEELLAVREPRRRNTIIVEALVETTAPRASPETGIKSAKPERRSASHRCSNVGVRTLTDELLEEARRNIQTSLMIRQTTAERQRQTDEAEFQARLMMARRLSETYKSVEERRRDALERRRRMVEARNKRREDRALQLIEHKLNCKLEKHREDQQRRRNNYATL